MTFKVSARRIDASGSLVHSKEAELVIDTGMSGRPDALNPVELLMSIYFAILAVSAVLLFFPVPEFVFALLLVQVLYKITTPVTVGSFTNPVVISNLVITAFFLVTLPSIFPAIRDRFSL